MREIGLSSDDIMIFTDYRIVSCARIKMIATNKKRPRSRHSDSILNYASADEEGVGELAESLEEL